MGSGIVIQGSRQSEFKNNQVHGCINFGFMFAESHSFYVYENYVDQNDFCNNDGGAFYIPNSLDPSNIVQNNLCDGDTSSNGDDDGNGGRDTTPADSFENNPFEINSAPTVLFMISAIAGIMIVKKWKVKN